MAVVHDVSRAERDGETLRGRDARVTKPRLVRAWRGEEKRGEKKGEKSPLDELSVRAGVHFLSRFLPPPVLRLLSFSCSFSIAPASSLVLRIPLSLSSFRSAFLYLSLPLFLTFSILLVLFLAFPPPPSVSPPLFSSALFAFPPSSATPVEPLRLSVIISALASG